MVDIRSLLCLVLLPCLSLAGTEETRAANDPSSKDKTPSIHWRTDYHAARREAAEKKLPLFIFTTFETCFSAHKMEAETLSDAKIVGLLNERFIPVKVDAERTPWIIESFHVQSFPTTIICSALLDFGWVDSGISVEAADGKILRTIEGYADVEQLMAGLENASGNSADIKASDIKDEERIQGTWAVVSVMSGGESLPKKWIAGIKVMIRGNEVVIPWSNCTDKHTLKLAPGGKPKKLELTGENGVDFGLYELERDRLIVGFPDSGRERPKDLSGKKGSNCLRITLERDKP